MEVKITLGAAQDAEKWSKNFSGAPPARTSEFFSPPEASRSAPGSIFIASWRPPGAQGVPRGSPEASGSSFLTFSLLAPFWHRYFFFWGAVLGSVVGPPGGDKTAAKAAEAAANVTEAVERNSSDSSKSNRKQ